MVTLADIRDAQRAVADRIHRTPLLSSRAIGRRAGVECHLKVEALQRTGSFKVRGALNKVRHLTAEEKRNGLIAVSAGNHAQAVAFAAAAEGIASTVVMPEHAPSSKAAASRDYGAEVILHGTWMDASERAHELKVEHGYTFVHPYDDPAIIAGQGTVGLEILEDLPDVDAVIVPVGGGGLIAGIATAVKELAPKTRVVGVEPEGAAALHAALDQGRVVRLERLETVADGLATPTAGEAVLEQVTRYLDDVVTVSDAEIIEALLFTLQRSKILTEPAGAAGVAALMAGKVGLPKGSKVAVVLSGGNMDLKKLQDFV